MTPVTAGTIAADLARTARIIAKHLQAMADDLDQPPGRKPDAVLETIGVIRSK
jgi:hypothetical protein